MQFVGLLAALLLLIAAAVAAAAVVAGRRARRPATPSLPPDDLLLESWQDSLLARAAVAQEAAGRDAANERLAAKAEAHYAAHAHMPFAAAWQLASSDHSRPAHKTARPRERRAHATRRSRAAVGASSDDGPAEPDDIDGVRPAGRPRPLCIALPSDERRAAR